MEKTNYTGILPHITVQVQPCPQVIVLDALQSIAYDFFKRTEAWQEELSFEAVAGKKVYELEDYSQIDGVSIQKIAAVKFNGNFLKKGVDYTPHKDSLSLNQGSVYGSGLIVKVVLIPRRDWVSLPEDIMDMYRDALIFGTLAKVKAMSGKNIEWTDPNMAQVNLSLYENEIMKAKVNTARNESFYFCRCRNY